MQSTTFHFVPWQTFAVMQENHLDYPHSLLAFHNRSKDTHKRGSPWEKQNGADQSTDSKGLDIYQHSMRACSMDFCNERWQAGGKKYSPHRSMMFHYPCTRWSMRTQKSQLHFCNMHCHHTREQLQSIHQHLKTTVKKGNRNSTYWCRSVTWKRWKNLVATYLKEIQPLRSQYI